MKTLRFLIYGLLATAAIVCRAQITDPGWFAADDFSNSTPYDASAQETDLTAPDDEELLGLGDQQSPIAEAVTPQIQALADSLQDDPVQIYQYVEDNIRFVLYFGSKKGAQLTLLEKSGNDFDQSSLLVALLRAAGYSPTYYFGWAGMPYDDPTGQNNDLHHWLNLGFSNTNWLTTSNYLTTLFGKRGYPATLTASTNTFIFQRVWVYLSSSSYTGFFDPAFKIVQPVSGINLTNAMAFSSNSLMSAVSVGSTDTGNYVTNLNEANLRGALTGYTTNLLNYVQSNYPNASVQQILGGQTNASGEILGFIFHVYNISSGGFTNSFTTWTYMPTNLMSSLTVTFVGTNYQCWMPQLQGQRLSLTFSNNGLAQLWLEDNVLAQNQAGGSSATTNVVIDINHPFGSWNFATTNIVRVPAVADNNIINAYQRTNSTYALIYAFEPDWSWLQQRENQLDTYRVEGYSDSSRQVVSETLNVMGLNWMLQTEGAEQMLAVQEGILPQYHHRFGRMAQEGGKGYYVDIYMQLSGRASSFGAGDPTNVDLENRHLDLTSYFDSALESSLIEQMQNSNLVASSTVKMLELANTNGQAVYLASSTNWSAISGSLIGYDTATLNSQYINKQYYLLMPQNGTNHVAGAGSWNGYGIAARRLTSTNYTMTMLISGGYNGAFVSDPNVTITFNVPYVGLSGDNQPPAVAASPVSTPNPPTADPIDTADGTFEVEHTDLSIGGAEPRGITFSRYYNGTRRHSNPENMAAGWINNYYVTANAVAAPQAGLGGTTPAQSAAMMVATRAAIGIYNDQQPDPKNWLTAALIAKWGVDQLTKNAVAVNLGKDLIQFIRQPDGSYTPPPNCTMTLIQTNGAYWLQLRHGNTFKFASSGYMTNIVDQYGQSLNVAYSSNKVVSITDWKGRALNLSYTNNELISVSDNSTPSHSISYGYSNPTNGDLISATDPEGKTTGYNYDTDHEITATIDANNQMVVSNLYDGLGHIALQFTEGDPDKAWQIFWTDTQTMELDPSGSPTTFLYDNLHRLIGEEDAFGNLWRTIFDGQNHVVATVSPLNETNRYIFDGNNNVIYTVDPLGFTNQNIFDSQNNLIQTIDPRGNPSGYGWNAQFSLIAQTNGAGDFVNYALNTSGSFAGTLANKTDSAGTTLYDGRDAYGQLTHVTYPNGDTESFANSFTGDVTNHIDPRGFATGYQFNKRRQLTATTAPTNVVAISGYDPVGNLLASTNALGFVTSNSWSATRKLLSTTLPATASGTPVVQNVYDNRDWLVQTINPLSQSSQYTNDVLGNVIAAADPLNRTAQVGYDADSRTIASTNAAGEKTLQQWSKRGDLTKTTDNAGHTVLRAYDGARNQITLTNRNNNKWQFQYDAANRQTNMITPLGRAFSQSWNHQGLIAQKRSPSGNTESLAYSPRNFLTSRTDGVGTTTYQPDANGNATNVFENGLTNSWTVDAYNHVSSYRDPNGFLIQCRRNANGTVTNVIYPGNLNVYYTLDSHDEIIGVKDWLGHQTTIARDLAENITSITRPNGTKRTISYDAAEEATNILEANSLGFPLALFRLNWNSNSTAAWEFAAPLPHTNSPPSRTMTYNADNELLKFNNVSVTNDLDGNLIFSPLTNNVFTNCVYDARNRLLSAGGVTNFYDAMNNRFMQTQGTNISVLVINLNAGLPQVLMRIKNGVTNYYIYGAGLLYQITITATSTNTLTYHFDYRGSTIALTDGSGNVTDRMEYSLYATTTYRVGTNDTPFLFNGRYGVMTDPNGLLYMRARYYNPYLCRFANPDPSGFSGGLNLYAYANGNPVSNRDPSGLGAVGDNNNLSWLTSLSGTPQDLSNPFGVGTSNSGGLNFETASTGLNIAGVIQFGTEFGSGDAVIGLYNSAAKSSGLYFNSSFWGGNQYVDTMSISDLAHGAGVGLFYMSAALEVGGVVTGNEPPIEGFRQVNAGIIGAFGGPLGAAAGLTYGFLHNGINDTAEQSFQMFTDYHYGVNNYILDPPIPQVNGNLFNGSTPNFNFLNGNNSSGH